MKTTHDKMVHPGTTAIEALELESNLTRPVPEDNPVPQVIECDFLVGAVRDIASVGSSPGFWIQPMLDRSYGKPKGLIDRSHPLCVTVSEVVIDRDNVHRNAREGCGTGS
jgi:hypothetical protein